MKLNIQNFKSFALTIILNHLITNKFQNKPKKKKKKNFLYFQISINTNCHDKINTFVDTSEEVIYSQDFGFHVHVHLGLFNSSIFLNQFVTQDQLNYEYQTLICFTLLSCLPARRKRLENSVVSPWLVVQTPVQTRRPGALMEM